MGYTIARRAEGVRGCEWVCDASCDWLPTEELLAIARVDVEGEGPGVFDVVQSTVNGVEYHTFTVAPEPEADPGITVAEAKALLEDAVNDLGPEAHDNYAGSCRKDREDAVSAVRGGADPAEVAASYFG